MCTVKDYAGFAKLAQEIGKKVNQIGLKDGKIYDSPYNWSIAVTYGGWVTKLKNWPNHFKEKGPISHEFAIFFIEHWEISRNLLPNTIFFGRIACLVNKELFLQVTYLTCLSRYVLKAAFPEIWSQDMNSSYFPPTFEFSNAFFLMVFAIKMLLDNIYGLLNFIEFKCDHFSGLLLAESQYQNSNAGGK